MKKLSTEELHEHIVGELKPIQNMVEYGGVYFDDKIHGNEGIHVFSNHLGYHFVYSEKGNDSLHKITDNLFEISFWSVRYFVNTIVHSMMSVKLEKIENQRVYLFEESLKLLEKLNPNYRKAEEILIDELIKRHPL